MLALSLNQIPTAQLLIGAGASPRKEATRALMSCIFEFCWHRKHTKYKERNVRRFLALLDKPVLQSLLTKRSITSTGAQLRLLVG